MGVNSEGRRKLEYSGQRYYWNVQEDDEDYGRINLNIVSEDKKLIVSYHVAQSDHDKIPHIVIQGKEFGGLENHYRQGWVRVQTPIWDDRIITPRLVRTIIEWCLLPKDQLIFVDWEGNLI
ncbi:hypothetical protein LOZ80_00700 [Paenibacillus sp. HWE-109]|uniref:hypothetical protein n=1 Tax=Paenibacillus sp. HWE-109 TaxID=1306526 RepID=UPI001EDF2D41|nr:hypothetical protein [Paenibacillus sp. HWE-109]UKS27506.1 hypothetical protein LOZ80_00700 [Paenibacillus sp. HWE-109]